MSPSRRSARGAASAEANSEGWMSALATPHSSMLGKHDRRIGGAAAGRTPERSEEITCCPRSRWQRRSRSAPCSTVSRLACGRPAWRYPARSSQYPHMSPELKARRGELR